MVFKGPAGFQRIIFIIMNIVMGIAITLILNLFVLHAPITLDGMVQSVVLSFCVGYTVGDLIPAMAWGRMLAAKLGLAEGLGAHLISSAVLAFFMATFILFFSALVNVLTVGGMAGVMGFFLMGYPVVLAVAYVAIVLFVPPAMKVASALSGFNPNQVPQE